VADSGCFENQGSLSPLGRVDPGNLVEVPRRVVGVARGGGDPAGGLEMADTVPPGSPR
jgi:hypothetical protein